MAPTENVFPLSELETRAKLYTKDYKEKSRKLPKDFSLKNCELEELISWSCMSQDEMKARAMAGLPIKRTQCYQFMRYFRHCKHGNHDFRVETTAWEGPNKWQPSKRQQEAFQAEQDALAEQKRKDESSVFAQYEDYFWHGKRG